MALGYTIHSIMRGKQELPVGTVQSFSDVDYKDMLALGAIRVPTEDELALYRLANPEPAAVVAKLASPEAPKSRAGRGAKKDEGETKAPAQKPEGQDDDSQFDSDPDVSDEPLV